MRAVLKGRYLHNRRSSTCGREVSRAHCLKGRTGITILSPQADDLLCP
ncbi:MAG: hypothetical protein LBS16_01205 [Prevotellaceae bacterium]|jgi:hypothetical protein|nr:hypothetical protein [Prevotellaceae bacterium]